MNCAIACVTRMVRALRNESRTRLERLPLPEGALPLECHALAAPRSDCGA